MLAFSRACIIFNTILNCPYDPIIDQINERPTLSAVRARSPYIQGLPAGRQQAAAAAAAASIEGPRSVATRASSLRLPRALRVTLSPFSSHGYFQFIPSSSSHSPHYTVHSQSCGRELSCSRWSGIKSRRAAT